MFTPWTVCLPSCSSKCVCRCALPPSRARAHEHIESTGRNDPQTSANLYDFPAFCRCIAALFSILHGGAGTVGLTHRLRPDQEVKALRCGSSLGVWSVLPAGSEQHERLFSHTETQPFHFWTKTAQAPDLSFVPNIPASKNRLLHNQGSWSSLLDRKNTGSIQTSVRSWRRRTELKRRTCFRPIISVFD